MPLLELIFEKIIPEKLIWLPPICTTGKPNAISINLVEYGCDTYRIFTSEGHDFFIKSTTGLLD